MAIRLIYRQMKQLQLLAWKPKWSAASACRTCQFRPLYRPYETLATSKGINGSTLHISSILGDHLKVGSGIGEPAMLLVANLFGPFHMFIPPIALKVAPKSGIAKSPTGITGLDQITEGGLPQGRPTLLCGTAGCGKTILAMEFLIRGATEFNEPGVFMSFEETDKELTQNFASMGFDLPALCARKKLFMDSVRVERSDMEETGEYDLEGLFIRLGNAIDTVGAKRVVLDTIESLFAGFSNINILRAELRRLFRWLKSKGVTAVITAETGDGKLTRNGIEEYVADCVILLDHRIEEQSSVRRLRVVKYRGTMHGTSECPFLIGQTGLSVLPLSALKLDHKTLNQRVSTGVPRLDAMLGGRGLYRATSVLVSGQAGTGKSSLAAHFVEAACQRGERALYMASEQSSHEIIRNMRSIGVDLEPWVKRGLLRFYTSRPGSFGLEKHLVTIHDVTTAFDPKVVVIDPITNFISALHLKTVMGEDGIPLSTPTTNRRLGTPGTTRSPPATPMLSNAAYGPRMAAIDGFSCAACRCAMRRAPSSNGLEHAPMSTNSSVRKKKFSRSTANLMSEYNCEPPNCTAPTARSPLV